MSKSMDKSKLATEMGMELEDLNYLLLESEIQPDPELTEDISETDADKLRAIALGTRQAIASSPSENRDKSQALARVPISEIAQTTGISEENINGMVDAIWQIELAAIHEQETKLEQFRNAARLATKSDQLKQELAAKINRLNSIAQFNPYDILGTNPEQDKEDLNELTANALDLANSILEGGKLTA